MATSDEARELVSQAYDKVGAKIYLGLEDSSYVVFVNMKYHVHCPEAGRLSSYRTYTSACMAVDRAFKEGRREITFEVSIWR